MYSLQIIIILSENSISFTVNYWITLVKLAQYHLTLRFSTD